MGQGGLKEYLAAHGFVAVPRRESAEHEVVSERLLRLIHDKRQHVVPMLAKAALYLRRHAKDLNTWRLRYACSTEEQSAIQPVLEELKKKEYVRAYEIDYAASGRARGFIIALSMEKRRQKFFRSDWAEAYFRLVARDCVREMLAKAGLTIPYKFHADVQFARVDDEKKQVVGQLDLVLEIASRFYILEVKSGPWVNIDQWVLRKNQFADQRTRVVVCTAYPNIPPEIFLPNILLPLDCFDWCFRQILIHDLGVCEKTGWSIDHMLGQIDEDGQREDACRENSEMLADLQDGRTLSEYLDDVIFHMPRAGSPIGYWVRASDGKWCPDYDLNAYLDD